MKRLIILLFLEITCHSLLQAQNWRFHIPLQVDAGAIFNDIERNPDFTITQEPGVAMSINTGASFLYRKRLQISATGGIFLNQYNFYRLQSQYYIAHFSFRSGVHLSYLSKPVNHHGTRLHLGTGVGYSFLGADSKSKNLGNFTAEAYSITQTPFYIAPEFGVSQVYEKGILTLALTYFFHRTDQNTIYFNFSKEDFQTRASSKEGYFGLRVRYGFRVRSAEQKKVPKKVPRYLKNNFDERKIRIHNPVYQTRQEIVKLKIADNAEEDGDSISVFVNDSVVLSYYEIMKKPRTVYIPLQKGKNEIVVYAHNEGRIPPNTATAKLIMGLRRKTVPVNTSLRRNQSIIIYRGAIE